MDARDTPETYRTTEIAVRRQYIDHHQMDREMAF